MNVVVYIGPSLSVRDAEAVLPDAVFRTPARSGDITKAVLERPKAIVLIDGLFEQVRSVRHKEILFALSEGVHVYGASSMGALRAAELAAFGMIGVGRIFDAYASGAWEDDDEVTVSHASSDFEHRSLSEAMANIRFGLIAARDLGAIDEAHRDRLEALAKRMFYGDRSWASLFEAAHVDGIDPEVTGRLKRFVADTRPNTKRDDALLVLERVRNDLRSGLGPFKATFDFEGTRHFRNPILIEAQALLALEQRTDRGILHADLATYVRVWGSPLLDEVRSAAIEVLPLEGPTGRGRREGSVGEALEILAPLGIRNPLLAWRAAATGDALDDLLTGERRCVADAAIALASLHDERIGALHDRLARRSDALARNGLQNAPIERTGLSMTELLGWYAEQKSFEPEPLEHWVAARGLDSADILLRHLIDEYLFVRLEADDDTA